MKEILALCATLLIILAYIPYIKDILNGKTKPHVYSWFISALVTFIAFGVQISNGASWGAVPTFTGAMAGFIIFGLSLHGHKRAAITKSDSFFLMMALIATGLWLIVDQPLLSVIIVSLIDMLAFAPTLRKSWKRPDQETISSYCINGVRFSIAAGAVGNYSFITVLYPLSQAIFDGLFALFLYIRRHQLALYPKKDQTAEA